MPKPKPRKSEPVAETTVNVPAGARVVQGVWLLGIVTLVLSFLAMFKPDWRLWAVHQFAFLHLAIAVPLLMIAGALLTPFGPRMVENLNFRFLKLPPLGWAAVSFVLFMLLSVHGNLLGDGQLSITRLAHVGDMLEANQRIPRGRFLSQKEPGTMFLHEGAFRLALVTVGSQLGLVKGRAAQPERVERQLAYRGVAQWCYRILSSLAGALLILLLLRFVRTRKHIEPSVFFLVFFACGGWLTFFGYVENYAWVSVAMIAFLVTGLKTTEPPRRLPVMPILVFAVAVAMHFMAIVLVPAWVYLLWTMHFEPRDRQRDDSHAPTKRLRMVIALFVIMGMAGYVFVKGWKGWISVMPLLPKWVDDGYALLSLKHGADLLNLALWAVGAALVVLLLTKRIGENIRARNQEHFLLLAAGSGAVFVMVFSPNLGMARDWDIVTAALWPTVFYGAWRLSQLEHAPAMLPNLKASLLSLIVLLLIPAVLVQSQESTAIARFKNLLDLDRSRSAYGWENLALYYQRAGELDERIHAWEQSVSVEQNPRYLFNLAEAYKLAGRMNEADTTAIAAARIKTEYAGNLFYYAVAQAKRGNIVRSKILVDTAIELNPEIEHADRMQTWANAALHVDSIAKSGDLDAARELVQRLIKVDSTNSFWADYALTLGR